MSRPRGLDGSSVLLDVLAMHTIEMIPKSMILNNSGFKNVYIIVLLYFMSGI